MSKTDRSHRAAVTRHGDTLNSARSRQSSRDRLFDDILKLSRPKEGFRRSVLKASRELRKTSRSPECRLAIPSDKLTAPFSKQLHELTASFLSRKPELARPLHPGLAEVWRQNQNHLQEKSKSRSPSKPKTRSKDLATNKYEGIFSQKLDDNRLTLKEKADQITKILRAKNDACKKSDVCKRASQSPVTERSRNESSRGKPASQTAIQRPQLSRGSFDRNPSRQEEYGIEKLRDSMRFRSSTGSSFKLLEKQLSKPMNSLASKAHGGQLSARTGGNAVACANASSLVQSSLTGEFIRKHISNKSAIDNSVVSKAREQITHKKKLDRTPDLKDSSLERPFEVQQFRNRSVCTRQRLHPDDREPREGQGLKTAVLKRNRSSTKRNHPDRQDSQAPATRLVPNRPEESFGLQDSIEYFKEPSLAHNAAAIKKAVSQCFDENRKDTHGRPTIKPGDFEMHEFVETIQREIQEIGHKLDNLIGTAELESSLRLRHSSEYVSTQRESNPDASSFCGEQSVVAPKQVQYTNVKGEPVTIPALNLKPKALPGGSQTPTDSKQSGGCQSDRTQDISYQKKQLQEVRKASKSFLNQVDEEAAVLSERRDIHRISKKNSISDIELPNEEEIVIREVGFKKKQASEVISEPTKALIADGESDTIFETFGAEMADSREDFEAKDSSSPRLQFKTSSINHLPSGQPLLQIPSLAEKWKSRQHKPTHHRNLIVPHVTAAASSKPASHAAEEDRTR